MLAYTRKFSSATKRLLSEAPETEDAEASFLLRINGEFDDACRAQLEPLVTEIRSSAGDIVSVTAPFAALAQLAALDFVIYVEASSPMYMEAPPLDAE